MDYRLEADKWQARAEHQKELASKFYDKSEPNLVLTGEYIAYRAVAKHYRELAKESNQCS